MSKIATFDEFEKNVMEKLLDGYEDTLINLRKQYEKSKVINREFTGVGFFTTFDVSIDARKLEEWKSFQFGDVVGQINGITDGVGFVLYIKNGKLHMLEGYTYDSEKWPEIINNFELSYVSGTKRNMEKLRSIWR